MEYKASIARSRKSIKALEMALKEQQFITNTRSRDIGALISSPINTPGFTNNGAS